MRKKAIAIAPDLFRVCRRYYTRPEAEVAAEALFCSQLAKHTLRGGGRIGFYKEDAELAEAIGKHPSSIRRALATICAKPGEERPEALFIIEHGPKPWEQSGRYRWLFRTLRGDELIHEALGLSEARNKKRQKALIGRGEKTRPMSRGCAERSAQNEPTPIKQNHLSESQSESLSSPHERERTQPELNQKKSAKVEWVRRLWNESCDEAGESALAWHPGEVERASARLIETIEGARLDELSDDQVLRRFRQLCRKDSAARFGPNSRFKEHNRHGITAQSFALYGRELMRAVEAELSVQAARPARPRLAGSCHSPSSPPKKVTSADLERLVKAWEEACTECDGRSFVWNPDDVEKHTEDLCAIIQRRCLHHMADRDLLSHLAMVVRTFASNRISGDRSLQVFVSKGEWLLGEIDRWGQSPKSEVAQ